LNTLVNFESAQPSKTGQFSVGVNTLILHRIIRQRLKAAGSPLSPRRALQMLATIQKHIVHLGASTTKGLSNITTEQSGVYSALNMGKPTSKHVQLELL
jgi:hypothetical protein